ncbi:hypothetical protein [Arthrobacter sp. JCM 19049]|uniref:hypothetical protein n=1 Tax=Arthrobacter sp. JCM 19049 TaxID=1460643 RepID=UPI0027963813|nr:hypothetical protein [Arthrobacter sp. JCM 19049]
MVDLHCAAGSLPAHKGDALAGVGVIKYAAEHHAFNASLPVFHVLQVPGENVIARVAPVAVGVLPALAEFLARVPGLRGAALDVDFLKQRQRFCKLKALLFGDGAAGGGGL